jgi:hypothetical protein
LLSKEGQSHQEDHVKVGSQGKQNPSSYRSASTDALLCRILTKNKADENTAGLLQRYNDRNFVVQNIEHQFWSTKRDTNTNIVVQNITIIPHITKDKMI